MTYSLHGKRVVVVGGSSSIAAAIAREVVGQGGLVTLTGRDIEKTTAAAESIGSNVEAVALDLLEEESIAATAARFGPGEVDHVVCVAAARAMGLVSALTYDAMATALNAKIMGPIMLAKHFTPVMDAEGSLLLFAGIGGWRPHPGGSVMAAGNAGVAGLVGALAVELAPIRVNAISPGTIDTAAWDAVPNKTEVFEGIAQSNPARRVGTPSDVAAASVAMLVNPFATGETFHLDGGGRWA